MSDVLKIVLMSGGPSAEREVSLQSGAAVMRALQSLGHQVSHLDPQNESWNLPPGTDLVFLALHGTYGEDGTVQSELEKRKIAYTGCGVQASKIAFDKILAKKRFIETGIPTPQSSEIRYPKKELPAAWTPPFVLKPARQGSSVGLRFVERIADWESALEAVYAVSDHILIEKMVKGREVTVGILGGKTLAIVEVRPKGGKYDYESKYTSGATEYLCPAPFDDQTSARIQMIAMSAFNAIEGRDYGRVDMIINANGQASVLEVNTLPGMTETSLLPMAAAAEGISFEDLCQRMVELAWNRKL
jgi:D-alanine-D-alanine ligase